MRATIMEHDADKIISNKLKHLEGDPIHWQKDETWLKINSQIGRKYYHAYYAIAASFFFCVLLISYFTTVKNKENINFKISSLEISIKKFEETQSIGYRANQPIIDSGCNSTEQYKAAKVKPLIQERQVIKVETIPNTDLENFANEDLPNLIQDSSSYTTVEIETKSVQEEAQSVRPILGVIPDQPIEDVKLITIRNKNLRFRFFKFSKENSFQENLQETKFVIARIK